MSVTIEEMTAEVAPHETTTRGQPEQAGGAQGSSSPQQERRQREQFDRIQRRASRVRAD